jgi:hypothetical protein
LKFTTHGTQLIVQCIEVGEYIEHTPTGFAFHQSYERRLETLALEHSPGLYGYA